MLQAVVYGLVDAFNPCLLWTLFFLMFMIFEFAKRGVNVSKHVAFFVATSYISLLLFSSGVFMLVLYAPRFLEIERIFYIFAGSVSVVWGLVHLRDWWGLTRQKKEYSMIAPLVPGPYAQGALSVKALLIVVPAAVVLAGLSTVWPPNQQILISSYYLFLPGKTFEIFTMLLIYNFMLVLPLLGVFILVESGFCSQWVRQAPSMAKMVFSALLIASGSSLIYIFQ